MRVRILIRAALLSALVGFAVPQVGTAQLGDLKRRAEAEAKKKLEAAAKKAAEDSTRKEAARKTADSSAAMAAGATAASATQPGGAAQQGPARPADPKVWENYDFVPGSKLLFFTDFSEDKVGNFARGLKYKSGPLEVVDRDGVKVLRSLGRSEFLIRVGRKLPERFTLEFDILTAAEPRINEILVMEGGPDLDRGEKSAAVTWHPAGTYIIGGGQNSAGSTVKVPDAIASQLAGQVAHVRVMMDGPYFKMYVNERRLYNIPELEFRRDSLIRVFMGGSEEAGQALYMTSIRLAESEVDVLYDALTAKGRWATQGILFVTGKADLQPESRPVLKEIAATLKQHPDLKLLIEGHTDNVGTPASNLTLSGARAAAVKAALVADYGVDAAKLTTQGLGDTKPAAPNTTATGRAQNRRVEVVKQ